VRDADQKRLYKMVAQVMAAAGRETSLTILDYLKDGEKCVCDIAQHVEANRSNVSRHLAVMLNAGLVAQRKDGLKMMCSLRSPCVLNITKCVTDVLRDRAQETRGILGNLTKGAFSGNGV